MYILKIWCNIFLSIVSYCSIFLETSHVRRMCMPTRMQMAYVYASACIYTHSCIKPRIVLHKPDCLPEPPHALHQTNSASKSLTGKAAQVLDLKGRASTQSSRPQLLVGCWDLQWCLTPPANL